jgi:transglutaminase-like putative cysteine protease
MVNKKLLLVLVCTFMFYIVMGASGQSDSMIATAERERLAERSSFFSLSFNPGIDIPLGSSADNFDFGATGRLFGGYAFSEGPTYFLSGGVDYGFSPIKAENSLSIIAANGGGGIYLDFSPRLSLKAGVSGGYYYGFFNDPSLVPEEFATSAGNPFVAAGLGFHYLMNPLLSLGIDVSYRNLFGLSQTLGVSIGTSFYLSGRGRRDAKIQSSIPLRPDLLVREPEPGEGLAIDNLQFGQVFPVFFKYYDDHPVGTARLFNQENNPVTDLQVALFVRQYMDAPKEISVPREIAGGQAHEIDLYALFTDAVMDITEGTKVAAELSLEYQIGEQRYRDTKVETLRMYDRNAMTWDDDRKAAAFITAKDPAILSFSKNVAGLVRSNANRALNENLLYAIGLFEALSLYGVDYVVDPRTPYIELSKTQNQVDFLQFPQQTLAYGAGDCDDLSILYCALLESVGIETAFVTVPGHLLMAFSTELTPEETKGSFLKTDELIFREDKVWIPVEVTERRGGFLKAWEIGSKKWREHMFKDQVEFYRIHDAWGEYEPVGLTGSGLITNMPSEGRILEQYNQEVMRFLDREILPQVAELEDEIARKGGSSRLSNKLGILYAKYGLLAEAEAEFSKILTREPYVPSLVNMGNLHYMKERWSEALEYYESALRESPTNPRIMLSVAKASHELENYDKVGELFTEIKRTDPKLAERYAYLEPLDEEGPRASDADRLRGAMIWEEED